jgi:RNA polymerase sigma factor (TIGR02999 family)
VSGSNVPSEVTELLHAHGRGQPDAFGRLVPLVYDDLRRVARSQLRRLRVGDTLDTTGLVHEAYLRLVDQTKATWHDRGHFLAVSAVAMRQVLIDHARHKSRAKRGGAVEHAELDEGVTAAAADAQRLIEIDMALGKLAEVNPHLVRVVECRYFAGLSEHETAEAMGVSLRTAQREWLKARAWLRQELGRK